MSETYDAVVVGLGAMGSAAVYQLAKAGASVLGIDQYEPPHDRGSTHGDTRITRLGIGEGAEYVPLVKRSHEIWREIEEATGTELLRQCGGLVMAGRGGRGLHGRSDFLRQSVASAEQYGVDHELLAAEQIRSRFPPFRLTGSETGYYEPTAGFLRPERCVSAQLRLAQQHGAVLRLGERVNAVTRDGAQVRITTDRGTVTAGKAVLTVGPWIGRLVPEVAVSFTVYRQVMYWFDLADRGQYDAYRELPVYIWEYGGTGRDEFIYGFPMIDGPTGGAKVATEEYTSTTEPGVAPTQVTATETAQMFMRRVRDQLPALGSRCVKARSCLYTVTPDSRFVIDRHPLLENVIVASPCSGHGFKHSAAIGEVLAQLVADGRSAIDIRAFSWR